MSFDVEALAAAIAKHGRVARVVIVAVRGSVPREPGASMLVWPGGQSGTIGGGALEFEMAARALNGPFVATVPLGPALGQCCGGAVELVCEIFDSVPQVEGTYARRVTGSAPQPGEGLWRDGWLMEPLARPRAELWVFGAGHVGRAVVDVLAPISDLAITWVDTGPERFPQTPPPANVRLMPAPEPSRALKLAPPDAYHLILTYSHAMDLDLCHAALSHGFAYCGLIGSQTKWARFETRLRALGHSDPDRITCPIGHKALGRHPHAIAVGVAQDLLMRLERTNHG